MVVLEYTHSDYSIKISTSDITGAWLKFKGRVDAPETYAKYQADPGGTLRLFDYSTAALSDAIPIEEWGAMRPVFYETNDYSISIRLRNLLKFRGYALLPPLSTEP